MQKLKALNGAACISNSQSKAIFELAAEHLAHAVIAPLQLPPDNYLALRINAVDLKHRLGDIETDGRDRLHVWLLKIVGALTAHTFMALTCLWRSRPQHQKQALHTSIELKDPKRGQAGINLDTKTTLLFFLSEDTGGGALINP
jgi:hypothetical protein